MCTVAARGKYRRGTERSAFAHLSASPSSGGQRDQLKTTLYEGGKRGGRGGDDDGASNTKRACNSAIEALIGSPSRLPLAGRREIVRVRDMGVGAALYGGKMNNRQKVTDEGDSGRIIAVGVLVDVAAIIFQDSQKETMRGRRQAVSSAVGDRVIAECGRKEKSRRGGRERWLKPVRRTWLV